MIILCKLFTKGSFWHKYRSIFLFWGHGGKMAYFLGFFFKNSIFYIVYKIMFWFKLRVHFGTNIEVFFYFRGMGGKMAYFFRFFFKKNSIFYIVYKNMFWFKLRVHFCINIEVFFYFGGMGVKWPIFSLKI